MMHFFLIIMTDMTDMTDMTNMTNMTSLQYVLPVGSIQFSVHP